MGIFFCVFPIHFFSKEFKINRNSGSVTAKRLREYQKSLGEHDLGFYQFDRNFSKSKKPVYVQFKDLKNGLNEDVVIAGKVIAIIPNRDVIPLYVFEFSNLSNIDFLMQFPIMLYGIHR